MRDPNLTPERTHPTPRTLERIAFLEKVAQKQYSAVPQYPLTLKTPINPPWANYGSSYAQLGYYRHRDGLVIVQGLLTWSIGSGAPLNINTSFPAPADGKIHIFSAQTTSGPDARIDLSAAGVLTWVGGGSIGVGGFLSLDGISYLAAAA